MQRKQSKTTRGPNAAEKRFQAYTKTSDCIVCGNPGPSIVDHCYGSICKENKILIGHWWVIPMCVNCDKMKSLGSTRGFISLIGKRLKVLWASHLSNYEASTGDFPPVDVVQSIEDYREHQP